MTRMTRLAAQTMTIGPRSFMRGNCRPRIFGPATESMSRLRTRYTAKKISSMSFANSLGCTENDPRRIQFFEPPDEEIEAGRKPGIAARKMPANSRI